MAQRKKLGTDLPPEAIERFTAWVEENNYVKAGAAVSAFRLLEVLPLELRDKVMKKKWDQVETWFRMAGAAMLAIDANDELLLAEAQPAAKKRTRGTG